jgi:hypothetical protein
MANKDYLNQNVEVESMKHEYRLKTGGKSSRGGDSIHELCKTSRTISVSQAAGRMVDTVCSPKDFFRDPRFGL